MEPTEPPLTPVYAPEWKPMPTISCVKTLVISALWAASLSASGRFDDCDEVLNVNFYVQKGLYFDTTLARTDTTIKWLGTIWAQAEYDLPHQWADAMQRRMREIPDTLIGNCDAGGGYGAYDAFLVVHNTPCEMDYRLSFSCMQFNIGVLKMLRGSQEVRIVRLDDIDAQRLARVAADVRRVMSLAE